jgi:hypothetical protein
VLIYFFWALCFLHKTTEAGNMQEYRPKDLLWWGLLQLSVGFGIFGLLSFIGLSRDPTVGGSSVISVGLLTLMISISTRVLLPDW